MINIVNELPWTIFVNRGQEESQVEAEIVAKLEYIKKYGIRWLNVHGLGTDNVKKILNIIPKIDAAYNTTSIIHAEKKRILVRFDVPPDTGKVIALAGQNQKATLSLPDSIPTSPPPQTTPPPAARTAP